MKTIVIDGRRMTGRDEAQAYLAQVIGAPDHYGNNLDALYDVLTGYAGQTRFVICNAAAAEQNLGGYARAILRVFCDAAAENGAITVEIVPAEPCGN